MSESGENGANSGEPDSGPASVVDSGAPATGDGLLTLRAARLQQIGAVQRALLAFRSLSPLVRHLLEDLPPALGASHAELCLHDPDGAIAELLTIRKLLGRALTLYHDSDPLYALYTETPETSLVAFDDERMFHILPAVDGIAAAVMMPVFDANRLLGSFHLGYVEGGDSCTADELPLFSFLAQHIGAVLLHVLENESSEKLTLVDPVTEVGNQRAFRRDMLREISWARRVNAPLSLLYISLDGFSALSADYGEVTGNFVERRISQRLCSGLRATDYMAHLSAAQFAVLLPSCSEPHAHDIGERMRGDIEQLSIDDGRGAVLHATLSIGMVCWEPARHPVESNERLSMQMESEALSAMRTAERGGGNSISVARLGLLML